uniref:Uncharacterized protein n=1 Tax=Arundo donax TaxID=35708 RepID=A0A0A9GSM8_ARUDO
MLMLMKKRNWTLSTAQEQRTGEVADQGAYLCHHVVGNDLFLPEDVPDLLTGVPPLLIDSIDHHDAQLHPGVLFLPEDILPEAHLLFLDGGHLIPGEDHLYCQDIHLHLLVGDLLMLAENHHLLGHGGHLLLTIVVLQLVHQGDHHLLYTECLLFDADYHQLDVDLHLQ